MDALDAQLAALQAALKDDVKNMSGNKSQTKEEEEVDWPDAPDLDTWISQTHKAPEVPKEPTLEELEKASEGTSSNRSSVATSTSASSSSSKPAVPPPPLPTRTADTSSTISSLKSLREQNSKAEADVDQLTAILMSNLNDGTAVEIKQQDFKATCFKCKQPILMADSACSAMGNYYHISCLCCTKCNKQIHGEEFMVVGETDPYCSKCYLTTLEKCAACGELIKNRILRAVGNTYHPECFKCTSCKKCLDGLSFTQNNEKQPYCVECFQLAYSPKCEACKNPIVPLKGETEALRIIALNKSYCRPCFVCEKCKMLLTDKAAGGCYPVDNSLFCKSCSSEAINSRMS